VEDFRERDWRTLATVISISFYGFAVAVAVAAPTILRRVCWKEMNLENACTAQNGIESTEDTGQREAKNSYSSLIRSLRQ